MKKKPKRTLPFRNVIYGLIIGFSIAGAVAGIMNITYDKVAFAEDVELIQQKVESIQEVMNAQNFFPPTLGHENVEPVLEEEYQDNDYYPNPNGTKELK